MTNIKQWKHVGQYITEPSQSEPLVAYGFWNVFDYFLDQLNRPFSGKCV